MAYQKIRDLAVATSQYTDASGQQKNRYENVGALMKGDDGSMFVLLKRTFNPAGVPFKAGSDQIIVSIFELRDQSQAPVQSQPVRQAPQRQPAAAQTNGDDDIPF